VIIVQLEWSQSAAGVPADGDRLTPIARPFSLGGVQRMYAPGHKTELFATQQHTRRARWQLAARLDFYSGRRPILCCTLGAIKAASQIKILSR
jgi:hypothetical protein